MTSRLQLGPLAEQLKEVTKNFDQATFMHIYSEHKVEDETLSKDGQALAKGSVVLEETRDGVPVSSMNCLRSHMFI